MFNTSNNLINVTSNIQRSLLIFDQEESEPEQESRLWYLIKDEDASTVIGGRSHFNQTLITEVKFPSLDSLNIEVFSSEVNQEPQSRIIFLNNCKPNGCTLKNH